MEKFNKNLQELLGQLCNLFPEQREKIEKNYIFNEATNDKYLIQFYENCKYLGDDMSSKNEIIFSKENIILDDIDFYSIWNSDVITSETKENIWKYLYTMYIFAYESIKEKDVKSVIKQLKRMSSSGKDLDKDTQILLNIVDSLTGKFSKTDDISLDDEDNKDQSNNFKAPDMLNGLIGDLAQEIASELDPEMINIDDPSKILKDLLSGNFDEENDKSGITNLVKNITGKIQDKLLNGNIDESKLFNEAQSVINQLGGQNSNSPLGELFQKMMGSGLDGDNKELFANAANILNNNGSTNINSKILESDLSKNKTRDRLRNKLEKKKQALKEREENLDSLSTLQTQSNDNIDIDAIANEIENINSK